MNSNATFSIVSVGTRVLVAAGSVLIALVLFAAVLTIADAPQADGELASATPAIQLKA